MKQTLLAVFVLLLVSPAYAVEPVDAEPLPGGDVMITGEGPAEPVPSTAPEATPAPNTTGQVTDASPMTICNSVQTMSAVQGPDYVAGVDAYGRPVAPADVSGQNAIDVPERVDIPVQINVAQAMNLTPATEMTAVPGVVTVFKDGRVLYNNQDVSGPVSAYCQQLKPDLNVNIQQ